MPDTGPNLPPPPSVLPNWGGQGSPGASPGSLQFGWNTGSPSSPIPASPVVSGGGSGLSPDIINALLSMGIAPDGPQSSPGSGTNVSFGDLPGAWTPEGAPPPNLLKGPFGPSGGYNGGSMAPAPFGMTGQPGANFGGTQTGAAPPSGAIGGSNNPLLPTFPAGQATTAFPANTAGTVPTNLSGAPAPGGSGGWPIGGGFQGMNRDGFLKAMKDAGFGKPIGDLLWNFLQSGAGFNPQVAQALINSMQPMVQRGEADILEQFSAMGLRNSSPAAIGLGDFLSQVNLNEEQIFAQMYEQAVQNYLTVLLSGSSKKGLSSGLSGLGSLIGGAGNLLQGIGSIQPQPTPPTLPSNFFGG